MISNDETLQHQNTNEITLHSIKEFLLQKGGKVRYSELFDNFRDLINSSSNDDQFLEFLHNIATKKYNHETNEEWWVLKKKFNDTNGSNQNTGFFASTFQKTKMNISKIEHRLATTFNKENKNKSIKLHIQHPMDQNESVITNKIDDNEIMDETLVKTTLEDKIENPKQTETEDPITSVKEQAKKLNRLNTQSELYNPIKNNINQEKIKTNTKSIDIENFELTNIQIHEKEWLLICSRNDSYQDIAKYLSKYPYLAQKKDPFNGYTCAHWACRHGDVEVLKCIATALETDKTNLKAIRINHLLNSRTRAGYTCLHILYLFNHTELTSTLIQYGAQNIHDFSGKLGVDYAINLNDTNESTLDRRSVFISNDASVKRSLSIRSYKRESSAESTIPKSNSVYSSINSRSQSSSVSPSRKQIDMMMPPPLTNIVPRCRKPGSVTSIES